MLNTTVNYCRCTGPTLRFEPDGCFTCGRFLRSAVGTPDAAAAAHGERPGFAALLHAVDRKRRELDSWRLARPAPRHGRRVVIEPEPKTRADRGRVPKADAVRHLEHLTRAF